MVSSEFEDISDKVIVKLVENPDDLSKWTKAIKSLEESSRGITKSSDEDDRLLAQSLYVALLKKFPNLENYWIKYSQLMLRLGKVDDAISVYQKALQYLPYSLKLHISYLKFLMSLSTVSYTEIKSLFKASECKIGSHFHSAEFWELYLEFETNYNLDRSDKQLQYYLILRKVIEIPIYQFAHFHSKYLRFIESEITLNNVSDFVLLGDFAKIGIKNPRQLKEGSAKFLKDITAKLKKIFVDLYITTQYEVYKIFVYEAKLVQHFDIKLLSIQQLELWSSYLDYLEIKLTDPLVGYFSAKNAQALRNVDQTTVQKNIISRIILIYERCLIPTAFYDRFWIRYFWFLMNIGKNAEAKNVLVRANESLPMSVISTRLLLTAYESFDGHVLNARDYLMALITKFPQNLDVWKKFLDSENFLFGANDTNGGYLLSLIDSCLENASKSKDSVNKFASILTIPYVKLSTSQKLSLFQKYATLFDNSLDFWCSLIKFLSLQMSSFYVSAEEDKTIFQKITTNTTEQKLDSKSILSILQFVDEKFVDNTGAKIKLFELYENMVSSFSLAEELDGNFVSSLHKMHLSNLPLDNDQFW